MKLRELEKKDAPLMLEWMHDESVVGKLKGNFIDKTLADAEAFILASANKDENIHFAIVSDEDEYMGTASIKEINRENNNAELSIVVRSCAMGRGYSWWGLEETIRLSFEQYGLESVYWCVSREDKRAIRFYDKHNFHETVDVPSYVLERYEGMNNLKWYSVLKGDVLDDRTEVAGCKIVHIKTIPTVGAGELSFFEATHDVPFEFKRVYYFKLF